MNITQPELDVLLSWYFHNGEKLRDKPILAMLRESGLMRGNKITKAGHWFITALYDREIREGRMAHGRAYDYSEPS